MTSVKPPLMAGSAPGLNPGVMGGSNGGGGGLSNSSSVGASGYFAGHAPYYAQTASSHQDPNGPEYYRGDDTDRVLRDNTIAGSSTDTRLQNGYNYGNGSTRGKASSTVVARPGGGTNGGRYTDEWSSGQRGNSAFENTGRESRIGSGDGVSGTGTGTAMGSGSSDSASVQMPTRSNTLRKKSSVRRSTSLHRSSSRRSMKAGSVRSLALQSRNDNTEAHSAFYCPVPTKSNPTEALANRFQSWRKILKDLIAYHREIQNHYEQRGKSLHKLLVSLNNMNLPPGFIVSGGLDDAAQALRNFHKQSIVEANRAREIEDDVILALTGLRSDLNQKIKEIKSISGDFRNSVDKEMDATKKAVKALQDVIGQAELDTALTTGRQDPYLLRLAADRQLERQLQEENYLHQAFLNLERSGRELESIVVGEIQKSYNAYAGILKREAGSAWSAVEELRSGPVAMPKDQEWVAFISDNDQFINPDIPIRSFEYIHYPGQDHYACQEIRAGLLERKSKYLKSYTAGWYVLSPTHLHEFKSADKMQAPVMSLYLPDQKLGSHSTEGASSNKFVLKGRQTGSLHRGHTWVFRAESYDTMMAWYEDIYALTEKTPQERNDYARGQQHTRSVSRSSQHTYSSDGVVNEDDDEPFATNSPAATPGTGLGFTAGGAIRAVGGAGGGTSVSTGGITPTGSVNDAAEQKLQQPLQQQQIRHQSPVVTSARRPSPGGRFPSELLVNPQRGLELQAAGAIPLSPVSASGSGTGEGSEFSNIAAVDTFPRNRQASTANYAYQSQEKEQFGHQEGQSERQSQQQNYRGAGQPLNGNTSQTHSTSYEDNVPDLENGLTRDSISSGTTFAQQPEQVQKNSGTFSTDANAFAAAKGTSAETLTSPVSMKSGHAAVPEESASLTRKESEAVTISGLHIPGGYPPGAVSEYA